MPETKHESPDFFKSLNAYAKHKHETFWMGSQFLSDPERSRALCILCLDGEFFRIVSTINEGIVAQIRLQWWRDEIERLAKGGMPQKTLPGAALFVLLKATPENGIRILELIDAYDDFLSGQGQGYAAALFATLFGVSNHDADDLRALAASCGNVFSSANRSEANRPALQSLIQQMSVAPDSAWPWLCLFTLAPDWISGRRLNPFVKRWRIWLAFLGGEAKLAARLQRMLDQP